MYHSAHQRVQEICHTVARMKSNCAIFAHLGHGCSLRGYCESVLINTIDGTWNGMRVALHDISSHTIQN